MSLFVGRACAGPALFIPAQPERLAQSQKRRSDQRVLPCFWTQVGAVIWIGILLTIVGVCGVYLDFIGQGSTPGLANFVGPLHGRQFESLQTRQHFGFVAPHWGMAFFCAV